MTVYIDDAHIPASVQNGARTHTSKWCHLMADTTDELVAFAVSIGLRPSWIQYRGTPKEHFDVTSGKRWQAVRNGAVEIHYGREGVALMRAKRDGVPFDLAAFRAQQEAEQRPGQGAALEPTP